MEGAPSPGAPHAAGLSEALLGRTRALGRVLWSRGILGNFAAGMFVILPFVLTIAIIGWIGSWMVGLIGPGSALGTALRNLGLWYVADPNVAERFAELGTAPAKPEEVTPEALATLLADQTALWKPLIEEAGAMAKQ